MSWLACYVFTGSCFGAFVLALMQRRVHPNAVRSALEHDGMLVCVLVFLVYVLLWPVAIIRAIIGASDG